MKTITLIVVVACLACGCRPAVKKSNVMSDSETEVSTWFSTGLTSGIVIHLVKPPLPESASGVFVHPFAEPGYYYYLRFSAPSVDCRKYAQALTTGDVGPWQSIEITPHSPLAEHPFQKETWFEPITVRSGRAYIFDYFLATNYPPSYGLILVDEEAGVLRYAWTFDVDPDSHWKYKIAQPSPGAYSSKAAAGLTGNAQE